MTSQLQVLIPMAGAGSRFTAEGYTLPKPLIDVSGKPMIVQAVSALPAGHSYIFILRKEHLEHYDIESILQSYYPGCNTLVLDYLTEGQACTCLLAKHLLNPEAPLIIGACDNGMTYDTERWNALLNDTTVDAAIFTFRNNPTVERNPAAYGWVITGAGDAAKEVKCKQPVSNDPVNDHAVVGTFYFRKAKYFTEAAEEMIRKNIRVNNEFYVDVAMNEMIQSGQSVKVMEAGTYICWGTPNDLRTYEYWERFFTTAR